MDKKQEVVKYLVEVKGFMERERGTLISLTEFASISGIPFKTILPMFDPDHPRLPSEKNAEKIAKLTGSNRINEIMEYPIIDPTYLSVMRIYPQLKPDQQQALLRYIRKMTDEHSLEVVTA